MAADNSRVIRQTLSNDPAVGQLARDVISALNSMPSIKVFDVTAQYKEPMYISNPFSEGSPDGLLVIKINVESDPGTFTNQPPAVVFFQNTERGLKIDEIQDLSLDTRYNFRFLAIKR